MGARKSDEEYSAEEAARRRDEALRRALNTPPQPRKARASPVSGEMTATTRALLPCLLRRFSLLALERRDVSP